MNLFRTVLFLFTFIIMHLSATAQETVTVDSLKRNLVKAKTATEKIELLDEISGLLMSVDPNEAEQYGQQMIEIAEESRGRELMVKAYLLNGTRCSYWAGTQDNTARALEFFKKGENLAKENKLGKYVVSAFIRQSDMYLRLPDNEKAAQYANLATSKMASLDNDSLNVLVLLCEGDASVGLNSKIEGLRFFLNGLRLAEKIKNDKLMRSAYIKLSNLYASIEDYDKSIDYYTLAYNKLNDITSTKTAYIRVNDFNKLGNLYAAKKNYDLAIKYYERSLKVADSLKFTSLKMPAYISLLNVYLMMKEPEKSMAFMQSEKGNALREYLKNFGMAPVMDQGYGIIYSEMGMLDSAGKYFAKSEPFYAASNNMIMKMSNDMQTASFYKRKGEYKKAIERMLNVKQIAEQNGQLEVAREANKQLDTLYQNIGDYKSASRYSSDYYMFKDSLQQINKANELAQVEAQDEQERQKQADELAAEKKRQRNNIQYLAITIGIATLFLLMVIFGMFRVSAGTIKMLGFFAFLMFFEFIFLIFKKNIYSITHGEPWMDLLFMIGLAAILLPLHHWLEHKVLHYLTSQNRLTSAGSELRRRVFGMKNNDI